MKKTITAVIFAMTASFSFPAFAADNNAAMHGDMVSHKAAASPSDKAYREANEKMHQDMAMQFTGNPDTDFVRGMIPHHQGAIDMAEVELKYGKDPVLRALAKKIIADQKREISEMRAWLAKHK